MKSILLSLSATALFPLSLLAKVDVDMVEELYPFTLSEWKSDRVECPAGSVAIGGPDDARLTQLSQIAKKAQSPLLVAPKTDDDSVLIFHRFIPAGLLKPLKDLGAFKITDEARALKVKIRELTAKQSARQLELDRAGNKDKQSDQCQLHEAGIVLRSADKGERVEFTPFSQEEKYSVITSSPEFWHWKDQTMVSGKCDLRTYSELCSIQREHYLEELFLKFEKNLHKIRKLKDGESPFTKNEQAESLEAIEIGQLEFRAGCIEGSLRWADNKEGVAVVYDKEIKEAIEFEKPTDDKKLATEMGVLQLGEVPFRFIFAFNKNVLYQVDTNLPRICTMENPGIKISPSLVYQGLRR